MNEQNDTVLDIAPGDTPAEIDPARMPQQRAEMPEALNALVEQLIACDVDTRDLLGEIRVALDALVSRLPAPATETTAPVASSHLDYAQVVESTCACIAEAVPAGATLAVINKGDEAMLRVGQRTSHHYPPGTGGGYAGFYPADSTAAIAQLERARETGLQFLVIPAPAFWWLEHYEGLRRHLDTRYKLSLRRDDACVIYDLRSGQQAKTGEQPQPCTVSLSKRVSAYLDALLPPKAHVAIVTKGDTELLESKRMKAVHFPMQEDGLWAGFHPLDSAACIAHLDELRAAGVRWFVVPRPLFWWFVHYAEFFAHLDAKHRLIARQGQLCVVYQLNTDTL